MYMRKMMIIGIAALLLSACGGTTYQVAPVQAFESLSGIGTTPGMDTLPGGLEPVHASFESIPGDNAVVWQFTHEGEDLGRIIARSIRTATMPASLRSTTWTALRRTITGATRTRAA